ncbi:hypothetical protein RB2150_08023 [Rhodobacterales bacterium HTCC2150]|nr:hypothetical protein RB2150_08023 [Rhodobacterales bacterium HTCC2150] [Rhodobacteraceae bacterium HTCC2150]
MMRAIMRTDLGHVVIKRLPISLIFQKPWVGKNHILAQRFIFANARACVFGNVDKKARGFSEAIARI